MANAYVNVNFYGHNRGELSGTPDEWKGFASFLQLRRANILNVVGYVSYASIPVACDVYNYNAVLGPKNEAGSAQIAATIARKTTVPNPIYLITGFSSGGTSALYFARAIASMPNAEIGYIGLADAAFYKGESEDLMKMPRVSAKYPKNYYQTKGNAPDVAEMHGQVDGFTNFNLNAMVTATSIAAEHEQAVVQGNYYMINDVLWCLQNYQRR